MSGALKSCEKSCSDRDRETKTWQHQDSNAVRDSVATAFCIIHSKGEGVASLPADIAEEEFVEAGVDSFVMFAAPVLEWRNGSGFFGVCKADAACVLVADLRLWAEQNWISLILSTRRTLAFSKISPSMTVRQEVGEEKPHASGTFCSKVSTLFEAGQ